MFFKRPRSTSEVDFRIFVNNFLDIDAVRIHSMYELCLILMRIRSNRAAVRSPPGCGENNFGTCFYHTEERQSLRWRAIFHNHLDMTELGGSRGPVYIIGGGTVRHSTYQQRTFEPFNLAGIFGWPARLVARSVFVLTTSANNAVGSGEFMVEDLFRLP
jgi:hypothetical protein